MLCFFKILIRGLNYLSHLQKVTEALRVLILKDRLVLVKCSQTNIIKHLALLWLLHFQPSGHIDRALEKVSFTLL